MNDLPAPSSFNSTPDMNVAAARAAVERFVQTIKPSLNYDHYGRDPHDRNTPHSEWAEFKPRYVAILHVAMMDGSRLGINHACFKIDIPNTEDARRASAIEIL